MFPACDRYRSQANCASLELRAVMALARFWQTRRKEREAHRMLTKIYGWFTEGFETPDLKAAKDLLIELS
jgi:hypothetical protein